MANLDSFRSETASWLEAHCPASLVGRGDNVLEGVWGGRKWKWADPDRKRWLETMAERGWTAPAWPQEYGGGGLSPAEAKVLSQEMRARRIPQPLIGFGLTMIGPTLLQFGNDEQRREHLPRICRGEIRWCQGYSEPDAGSDLASLQTRAERDGDHFVVTGTKVWTSYADEADWIFSLVRSDPDAPKKQDGITFLLMDMDDPGVTVSPILLISGSSPFCETHFQDVRVPVKNVIGTIGGGWTVAKALLGHERSMIADAFGATSGGGKRMSLPDLARRYAGEERGRVADPLLRDRVAQCEMDTRAFLLTVQRSRDAARAGQQPGAETSFFKVYGTELNKDRNELMVEVLGPQALGWEGPGFDDDELKLTREWLRSRGNSIEGGTSEIQLNIIAKRVLGLPD
ncbi:MAG: acyl-CoA dehydrogenase family protein [Deltaproteobacteria bacterium]|nr:acyl-CoA dehydrogenase family protein [Deltaproteobacteria bacterium]